jgi:flavin reductase
VTGDSPLALTEIEERRQIFRDAMACVGAAANIVTSDGPAGRVGFSATAVCSVTDTPPTLLVCLNRSASVYEAVTKNQRLCINTLAPSHQALALLFGGKTPQEERFSSGEWTNNPGLPPILGDALVSFEGNIVETARIGSHDILFVEVKNTRINADHSRGLIYFGRKFHEVGHT